MKISVIIPAYNEEKIIAKCLDRLKQQTVLPDEVIVVDNNSTDNTAAVAREEGARVIHEPRQGITPARNAGFNAAKGEILVRTDADTIVPSTWIERIKKHFDDDPELDALCGVVTSHLLPQWYIRLFYININRFLGYNIQLGPNNALKKELWKKVEKDVCLKDTQYHEDMDLGIHTRPYAKYMVDYHLRVSTSDRRTTHPLAMVKYFIKWLKTVTLRKHRRLSKRWLLRVTAN